MSWKRGEFVRLADVRIDAKKLDRLICVNGYRTIEQMTEAIVKANPLIVVKGGKR